MSATYHCGAACRYSFFTHHADTTTLYSKPTTGAICLAFSYTTPMLNHNHTFTTLAFASMLFLSTPSHAAKHPVNKDQTRAQLQEINKAISQQQAQLDTTHGQQATARSALRSAEKTLGLTTREVRQVRGTINNNKYELKQLSGERGGINKKISQQEKQLHNEVMAAYSTGREAYLKLLLNQESPEKVSRLMRYYDYFHKARIAKMEEYQASIAELAAVEKKIASANIALQTEQQRLKDKQQSLELARAARDAVLAKLNSKAQGEQASLSNLEGDRKALEQVLHSLSIAITQLKTAGDTPFSKSRGKLPWPIKSKIISSFRSTRVDGRFRSNGILLKARAGQAVKSVAHGRVVYADWVRGFGMLSILDHGGGYMSLYGQNESLLKEPGDWVERGDVIALAGNSGGKTKNPALYFEIRAHGKPQNPKKWLKR